MPKLITVYWRDIPSQVMVRQGRDTRKALLPARFQEAIDRAAMRAGKGSSDLYLAEWRRDSRACQGDPRQLVSEEVQRLEAEYSDERLLALIRAKGAEATDDGGGG